MSYLSFRTASLLAGAVVLCHFNTAVAQEAVKNPFLRPLSATQMPTAVPEQVPALPAAIKLPPLVLPPPLDSLSAPSVPAAPSAIAPKPEQLLDKPKAFLSRQEIEQARARCLVSFPAARTMQVPESEAEHVLQFSGGANCLNAVSTEGDWLEARMEPGGVVLLRLSNNESSARRTGYVTVVTPRQTFRLTVTQAGAPAPKPAPAPALPELPPKPVNTSQELSAK